MISGSINKCFNPVLPDEFQLDESEFGPWKEFDESEHKSTPNDSASPESLREPVDDHFHHVAPHHDRRRELRIVAREAVGVLHEEMVNVRHHARSHVLVSALLERGLL